MRDPIIGIDLGTSNTVVAHVDATGKPVVLADDGGAKIHPSVVSFHPNGGVVVGAAAKQRKVIDPQNTIYSFKRLIGRSFRSVEVKTAMGRSPFAIKEGENSSPLIVTRAGEFAVPEISAIVLDYARNIAAERLNSVSVNRAVVTVPASFNDAQRSATATAGQIANLDVVRVLNEPTAAALAYGHTRNLNDIIAVYDFGGGTFDITILKLADQVYEVLGTAGDTFLGGDDLDERIVERMVSKFLAENRIDLRNNEVSMMRLRAVAEQTKIELSRRSRAVVRIDEIAYGARGKPLNLNIEITRDEFVKQVADIIDRTFPVCQESLALAGLGIDQIADVILVGGTTKIPYVRDQVARFFAKAPRADVNPEEAVAVGAALQANALERSKGRAAAAVASFDPAEEATEDQLTAIAQVADDEGRLAPGHDLATGAPRIQRPTAGYAAQKPDTSYKATRPGVKDVVGKTPHGTLPGSEAPPAITLARMTKNLGPGDLPQTEPNIELPKNAPKPPGRATAPGMGATPPPTPVVHKTQRVPVVQPRTPAPATPPAPTPAVAARPAPRAPTPPPVPPPRPAGRSLTNETSPSISGEIDTQPGTQSTFPGFAPMPTPPTTRSPAASDSFSDLGQRFDSRSDSSQGDSYTDADAVPPTKAPASFSDDDQLRQPSASDSFSDRDQTFGDFETQEKLVPPAPVPSPGRPVPAALPNARTMIAPQPTAPTPPAPPTGPPAPRLSPRLTSDFEDDQVPAATTARGLPPAPAIAPPRFPAAAPTLVPAPAASPFAAAPIPDPVVVPAPAPVILDVTPRGLGIATVAGFCEELIRRNSRLPAAQRKLFTTSRDSQDLVRIVVCQGESRRIDNNTVIGDLILNDLPRRPRGETSIEVTFQLDASGILQVVARDAQTGREQSAMLDLVGGMAQQDVAASRDRIAALRR